MEQIKHAIEQLERPEVRDKFEAEEKRERKNDAETAKARRDLQMAYRNTQKQHVTR